jgi:hypothetical protein
LPGDFFKELFLLEQELEDILIVLVSSVADVAWRKMISISSLLAILSKWLGSSPLGVYELRILLNTIIPSRGSLIKLST